MDTLFRVVGQPASDRPAAHVTNLIARPGLAALNDGITG
jgi:hypothetical protein